MRRSVDSEDVMTKGPVLVVLDLATFLSCAEWVSFRQLSTIRAVFTLTTLALSARKDVSSII